MTSKTKQAPAPASFDAPGRDRLRCFPELIEELGGDPEKVMQRAGLDTAALHGDGKVAFSQVTRLMELAADGLNCPDFGMRLAVRKGPGGMFAQVGEEMARKETFGEALRLLASRAEHRGREVSLWLKRYAERDWTVLGHAVLSDGPLIRAQLIEELLLLSHLKMLDLTGGQVRSRRILFRHQPVAPLTTYRRHFGCEVVFGQNIDAIVYFDRDLACPIASIASAAKTPRFVDDEPDEEVHAPLRSRVRIIVMHYLSSKYCTREQVAESLKLHPRTMDRRLAEEGTAFLDIKTEVRRNTLIYYLAKTELDFVTVSQRLGYSEQAVMSRNCRKWFGKTPRQIRIETRR